MIRPDLAVGLGGETHELFASIVRTRLRRAAIGAHLGLHISYRRPGALAAGRTASAVPGAKELSVE